MAKFNKILCPVDLSKNSLRAVQLATTIAKDNASSIVFLYVAPQWLPDDSIVGGEYIRVITEDEKREFENLRPDDPGVEFEHIFRQGNAGIEIVNESNNCDMIVMSTHGYGALMRLLVGSVAQYAMRHAKCTVIVVRNPDLDTSSKRKDKNAFHFVTEVMHQVSPIYDYENVEKILAELDQANETAAPVIDTSGRCIGILTKTDIENYRRLQERFANKDKSVLDEMFVVDKYGMRRPRNHDFVQVKRHMSSPVVTILNSKTLEQAKSAFAADEAIHHLVVVDEKQHPLGIIEVSDCHRFSNTEKSEASSS